MSTDNAGGTMAEADDGGGRFTEVVLRPQVTTASPDSWEDRCWTLARITGVIWQRFGVEYPRVS